jgi:peptidoglycan-associated lipoprotein
MNKNLFTAFSSFKYKAWIFCLLIVFALAQFSAGAQDRPISKLSRKDQFKMVQLMLKRGSHYEAINVLKEMIKIDPKNVTLQFTLGTTYYAVRDYRNAEKKFVDVNILDPSGAFGATYYYAVCVFHRGEYVGAYSAFKTFAEIPYKGNTFKAQREMALYKMKACKIAEVLVANPNKNVEVSHLGDKVNSAYSEFSPCLRDTNTLIFASIQADTVLSYQYGEAHFSHVELMESDRDEDGDWGKARRLPKLNKSGYNTANGNYNTERNRFYFTRCKPDNKHKMVCHIYMSEIKENAFQKPKKLGDKINAHHITSTQPSISHTVIDGIKYDVLYFVSDRQGGYGGLDIYYAIIDEKSEVKLIGNLGNKVNTPGNEVSPTYDDGLKTMFFSSDYLFGLGGYDIFKTYGGISVWSKPINMGIPYNSGYDDTYFTLTPDAQSAFISSNRPGGYALVSETCCDDLYSANVSFQSNLIVNVFGPDEKKIPEELVKIGITDRAKSSLSSVKDSLINYFVINPKEKYNLKAQTETDTVTVSFNTSSKSEAGNFAGQDTVKSVIEYRKGENYFQVIDIYLKGKKLPIDTVVPPVVQVNVSVADTITLPSEFKITSSKGQTGDTSSINTDDSEGFTYIFHFGYKSSDFIHDQEHNFDYIVKFLKKHPDNVVFIEAHTDNIGNDAYNIWLSQSRAERIKVYLISHGISKRKIKAIGYGENQPVADNFYLGGMDNPAGRAKNRRAIIKVAKPN